MSWTDGLAKALRDAAQVLDTAGLQIDARLQDLSTRVIKLEGGAIEPPPPPPPPPPSGTVVWTGASASDWSGKEGTGGTWSGGVLTCGPGQASGGTRREYPYLLKAIKLPAVVHLEVKVDVDLGQLAPGAAWLQLSTVAKDNSGTWSTETLACVDSSGVLYSKKLGSLGGAGIKRGQWHRISIYLAIVSGSLYEAVWLDGVLLKRGAIDIGSSVVDAFHAGYYSDAAVTGSVSNRGLTIRQLAAPLTSYGVEP